jgi:hypothetical protein
VHAGMHVRRSSYAPCLHASPRALRGFCCDRSAPAAALVSRVPSAEHKVDKLVPRGAQWEWRHAAAIRVMTSARPTTRSPRPAHEMFPHPARVVTPPAPPEAAKRKSREFLSACWNWPWLAQGRGFQHSRSYLHDTWLSPTHLHQRDWFRYLPVYSAPSMPTQHRRTRSVDVPITSCVQRLAPSLPRTTCTSSHSQ